MITFEKSSALRLIRLQLHLAEVERCWCPWVPACSGCTVWYFSNRCFFYDCLPQEAAQALIYAGMAGSKLEGIQEKVNEYLDRVQALHNAGKLSSHGAQMRAVKFLTELSLKCHRVFGRPKPIHFTCSEREELKLLVWRSRWTEEMSHGLV